ncbi:MAG: RpiB/LacA/LacB family sugar-phosphate isomerase, partial [Flavobacteriales bacterium]
MRIAIGSDHAGFRLKQELVEHLRKNGSEVEDEGTRSEESTDYPGYAHAVANAVTSEKADLGIVICGSGNG